jgi:hypothetical protein
VRSGEAGDEEPSLGWTDAEARKGVPFQGSAENTDLEEEHDGRGPSLGEPERSCEAVPWGLQRDYTRLSRQVHSRTGGSLVGCF